MSDAMDRSRVTASVSASDTSSSAPVAAAARAAAPTVAVSTRMYVCVVSPSPCPAAQSALSGRCSSRQSALEAPLEAQAASAQARGRRGQRVAERDGDAASRVVRQLECRGQTKRAKGCVERSPRSRGPRVRHCHEGPVEAQRHGAVSLAHVVVRGDGHALHAGGFRVRLQLCHGAEERRPRVERVVDDDHDRAGRDGVYEHGDAAARIPERGLRRCARDWEGGQASEAPAARGAILRQSGDYVMGTPACCKRGTTSRSIHARVRDPPVLLSTWGTRRSGAPAPPRARPHRAASARAASEGSVRGQLLCAPLLHEAREALHKGRPLSLCEEGRHGEALDCGSVSGDGAARELCEAREHGRSLLRGETFRCHGEDGWGGGRRARASPLGSLALALRGEGGLVTQL